MSITDDQLDEIHSIRADFAKAREELHKENSKGAEDAFEEQVIRRAQAIKFLAKQGVSNRRLAVLFRAPILAIITAQSTETPEPEPEKPKATPPKAPEREPEVKAPPVKIEKPPARRRRDVDDTP